MMKDKYDEWFYYVNKEAYRVIDGYLGQQSNI